MCCCTNYTKRTENVLKPLCILVACTFSLVIMILSIVALIPFYNSLEFIAVAQNWNNMAIEDISALIPSQSCPDGDEKVVQKNTNMFTYTWEGMTSGCDCTDLTLPNPKLNITQKCGTISTKCVQVNPISEVDMHNWDNSDTGQGIKFCLKRIPKYNFISTYLQKDQCKNPTDIMCGGPSITSKFCVPSTRKCPITSIKLGADAIHTEQIGLTGIFVSRNEGLSYPPLSEFKIEQGLGVCTNPYEKNFFNNLEEYSLELDKKKYCLKIDPKWEIINKLTKKSFFNINNQASVMNLKGQQLVSNSGVYFGSYQRGYILWKMECRQNNDFNQLIEQIIQVINLIKNHVTVLVLSALDFALHILFILFWMCECCKRGGNGCCCIINSPFCCRRQWLKRNNKENCSDFCRVFDPITVLTLFFKFLFEIIELALMCVSVQKIGPISKFASDYSNKQCSDDITNNSLQLLSQSFATQVIALSGTQVGLLSAFVTGQLFLFLCIWKNAVDLRRKGLKSKLAQLNKNELPDNLTFGSLPDQNVEIQTYPKQTDSSIIQNQNNLSTIPFNNTQMNTQQLQYNQHNINQNQQQNYSQPTPYFQQEVQQLQQYPQNNFQYGLPMQIQPQQPQIAVILQQNNISQQQPINYQQQYYQK